MADPLAVGYSLNRLDEPVRKAVSKTLLTEFDIHHRLESFCLFFRNSRDVSLSVQFSRQEGLPLSVRSGGHSYICSSLKGKNKGMKSYG